MKRSKCELERIIKTARTELDEIMTAERQKASTKLVGKCFKYSNSYGSGQRWWLYAQVTGVGDCWPECLSFQRQPDGIINIKIGDLFTSSENWQEISLNELAAAWLTLTKEIDSIRIV